jgi:formylglycine-generating enzyme required for sulfatase activity
MVTVGNPGNANDIPRLDGSDAVFGAVDYTYQIGKYDVTIGQYTSFLNAVATTDTYSLYDANMGSDLTSAGISREGLSGSYTYSVIGPSGIAYGQSGANRPITFVSWFDAARFANWMTNGQGAGSTETGAYTLNGATSGDAPAANPGAAFYIPTENEWYKAAYYSPNAGGVGVPGYYVYATQSDSPPGNIVGSRANQANYAPLNAFSLTQSFIYDSNQNYLTDVGAFSGSGSFYGTFDQSGNVYQWNDLDGTVSSFRGLRGGLWYFNDPDSRGVSSSFRYFTDTHNGVDYFGIRLASPVVPEPSTCAMVLAGLACGGYVVVCRRKRD